jgi:hypothetical protein
VKLVILEARVKLAQQGNRVLLVKRVILAYKECRVKQDILVLQDILVFLVNRGKKEILVLQVKREKLVNRGNKGTLAILVSLENKEKLVRRESREILE